MRRPGKERCRDQKTKRGCAKPQPCSAQGHPFGGPGQHTVRVRLCFRQVRVLPLPAFVLRLVFGRDLADEVLLSDQRAVPAKLLAAGFEFTHPTIEHALDAAFAKESKASMAAGVL